jgi:hypothetical protein
MNRTVIIMALLARLCGVAHADCLTPDERKAANQRYKLCVAQADSNLYYNIDEWNRKGCNNVPQPYGCHPPYPFYFKEKGQCLEEFKAGVTE